MILPAKRAEPEDGLDGVPLAECQSGRVPREEPTLDQEPVVSPCSPWNGGRKFYPAPMDDPVQFSTGGGV